LLAPRESARGAVSLLFVKNKSGRAEPIGAANSAVSAARSAALTIIGLQTAIS
jgi:hypothetical protein